MQLFGIGPLELVFILIVMILILGPKRMVQGAQDLGKTIRKVTRSQFWKDVQDASREIRDFPRKIMEESGVDDDLEEIKREFQPLDKELLDRKPLPYPSDRKPKSDKNIATKEDKHD